MPDIRLIALDLDGTVFDDEKRISPRTLAAIRAALDCGIDVLPATGRNAAGVPDAFMQMPGVRFALTSNGASVVELASGRPLVRLPFEADFARRALAAVQPFGGAIGLFVGGDCYSDPAGTAAALASCPPALLPYIKASRRVTDNLDALIAQRPGEVEKFSILYPDAATRDAARAAVVAACPGIEATSSIPNNLELNAPGVNKGRGLLALADYLGLSASQVMACGDSGNDLAMVQLAGVGVAMGNATPDVLAAADFVTLDNNHDGVAAAIETLALGSL